MEPLLLASTCCSAAGPACLTVRIRCRRAWDFGVYVSIPSVSPLRAYVYDNIVLRLCREPYQQDLSNAVSGPCAGECSLGLFSAADWGQAPLLLPSSARISDLLG